MDIDWIDRMQGEDADGVIGGIDFPQKKKQKKKMGERKGFFGGGKTPLWTPAELQ